MFEQRLRQLQAQLMTAPDPTAEPLLAGLPQEEASRAQHWSPRETTPAAVLVPLLLGSTNERLLLIKRADSLRHHAGQIAFPGGRCEAGESCEQTARREAFEECGIPPEAVRTLGFMPDCVVRTGFRITPVVGVLTAPVNWVADGHEVAELVELPLRELCDRRNHHVRSRQIAGVTVKVIEIDFAGHVIWGATAGILLKLVDLLEAAKVVG